MNKKNAKLLAVSLVMIFISLGIAAFYVLTTQNQPTSSDEIRIACVGDSLTQSSGYPYELWKLLGSSAPYTMGNSSINPKADNNTLSNGTRFAVGNFGAGSTTVLLNTETPYMNTSMFQSALDFQPDIVVIMLGTNDAQPNLEQFTASFVGDYMKLIAAFQALPSKPDIWVVIPPPIIGNQSGSIDPEYFTLTIIPSTEQVANETNLPTINVYSAFALNAANYSDYYRDGVHVNSAGAKLIADEVYSALTSYTP
jgi:acyl-CoA thioesterase I